MHTVLHIIMLVNAVLCLAGLVSATAALVGLAWQQEIPQAWLDTLRSGGVWAAAGFTVFALWRWYLGEFGWMALGFADAFICVGVCFAAVGLVWRDEPEVHEAEVIEGHDGGPVVDGGAPMSGRRPMRMVVDGQPEIV